ncbi:tetraacyldisaccharide 4'-kinase [hot springs metagenome]|uniref:tetraacyldisaccharide 4'-kinase n=1 Tax=hot springs metagenome TaxID=433727 RepID=A0A5J4L1B7_9ZZZZ
MTFLEFPYYIGYSLDKCCKLKQQKRLPNKVISIGNITVGGTGKTPATIAIAEEAKRRGFSPIILTRGYKGKVKGPVFVQQSRDTSPLHSFTSSSRLYGDEPVLMAERLKDVLIVKCADRYEGGMFALSSIHRFSHLPIIFILDDGFQHWRLYRDIDIVLIDGLNPFGNRRLLPIGPLREPLNELKRADIFVVTKTKNKALSDELGNINPDTPVYFSEYRVRKIMDMDGNEYPVEMLKDKNIYAFCGIANPDSFMQIVRSICGDVRGFKAYRDHYLYSQKDIIHLTQQCKVLNCDFLLTTEKDMVKIKEIQNSKFRVQNILYLEVDFCAESEFFDLIFKSILKGTKPL